MSGEAWFICDHLHHRDLFLYFAHASIPKKNYRKRNLEQIKKYDYLITN